MESPPIRQEASREANSGSGLALCLDVEWKSGS